jgi:tetratricopeptide (TPR) repeat protein
MREEREPLVTRVEAEHELYAMLTLVRSTAGAGTKAVRRLEQLMEREKPAEIEPYLDLASAQLRQRRWRELEKTAAFILIRDPRQELAREWLGMARAGRTGNPDDAIRILTKLERPEAAFNAGVLLAESGRTAEAIPHYERALAARPNLVAAWFRLGEARQECGDRLGAIDAFRRALEIDPNHAGAQEAFWSAAAEPPL